MTTLAGCGIMVILATLFAAVTAFMFQLVWNFVAPTFGWPLLDFWQALAVTFLLSIVGSFFRKGN